MINRALLVYLVGCIFYCGIPIFLGLVDDSTLQHLIVVVAFAPAVIFVINRSSGDYFSWPETLLVRVYGFWFWLSIFVFLILSFSIYLQGGAEVGRNELFELRQSVLSPLAVLVVNIGMVSAALLASRERWRLVWLSGPLLFESLTQSRGFIITSIIAFYVAGGIPSRFVFLSFVPLVLISAARIEGVRDLESILSYIAAESINTGIGTALVSASDFEVSVSQGMRSFFALLPLVGSFVDLPSEAIQYNKYLQEMFEVYGLAFGVIGFAKFSSVFVIFVTIGSGAFCAFLLRLLGVPRTVLIVLSAGLLPMFYRWSPGEFYFLATRTAFIFWISLIVGSASLGVLVGAKK